MTGDSISFADYIEGKDLIDGGSGGSVDLGGVMQDYVSPRVRAELDLEYIRDLCEADLAKLNDPLPEKPTVIPTVKRLQAAHHHVARLMTTGQSYGEISAQTGYTISTISALERNPAFQELLAHYSSMAEMVHADVLEQTKSVGLAAIGELQRRFDENPEKFSDSQLTEIADKFIVKPYVAGQTALASVNTLKAGAEIAIKFVGTGGDKGNDIIDAEIISETKGE